MVTVLHICPAADWERVPAGGEYRTSSLHEVGFVHCADRGTVQLPANRFFPGRTDLVLLEIDTAGLDVRWEPPVPAEEADGPWFPHVYQAIPAHAVVALHEFRPDSSGVFLVPEAVAVPSITHSV